MTTDRRLLAGVLGLSLVLAACGGSSTATASPAGATAAPATQAAATAEAAATEAPATAETPTESPSDGGPDVSFVTGAAGDLEAKLPDEANGVKFTKTSFDAASLGASGIPIDTGELDPILKANGKSISDVRVAIAAPSDPSATTTAMVIAFQVKGLPADKFVSLVGDSAGDLKPATIGGKSVKSAASGPFSVVVYTKDDIVYEVLLGDAKTTEAIVSQLP